jgi:2-desacetyl-2-hydroxyethyl bacteriochlorophyllide A dehydrogenase
MKIMNAAVLVAPRRFEIQEKPIPSVGPDDALLRVDRCGICGTDVHIFNGHYAADKLPLTPGHELAGAIVSLGANVRGLSVGSRAVVDINIGCGRCYYCRRNELLNCPDMGQVGITRDGAFAQFVCVPARLVIPVPADSRPEILALTEPVACVVRAARKAQLSFGQSALVIGAGPIGNLHVQMLRLLGLAPIIVLEPSAPRGELARWAGADVVETDPERIREVVLANTEGRGVDVAIESVGKTDLYALAFELIRPGGHLAAFGIAGADERLPVPLLETVLREKSIKGSVAGMGEDMHDALTLLRHGRFRLEPFVAKSYPLADIQRAFEELPKDPATLKAQIVF